jgi:hypothetical protein
MENGVKENTYLTIIYRRPERAQWVEYARSLDDQFREYIGPDVFDEYVAAVQQAKDMVKDGTAYTVEPKDLMDTVNFG